MSNIQSMFWNNDVVCRHIILLLSVLMAWKWQVFFHYLKHSKLFWCNFIPIELGTYLWELLKEFTRFRVDCACVTSFVLVETFLGTTEVWFSLGALGVETILGAMQVGITVCSMGVQTLVESLWVRTFLDFMGVVTELSFEIIPVLENKLKHNFIHLLGNIPFNIEVYWIYFLISKYIEYTF